MSGSPTTVDTLKVDLDMDPTGFKSGTEQGISALDRLAAKIGITSGVAAAAGTLIGNAIGRGLQIAIDGIRDAIKHIDDLNDASMRVGTSVEHFSALEYVARLTGTTIGTVETSLRLLANAMDDVANNKSTAATKALNDLGISVKDANGNLRDSHDVLLDVADRFAGLKDGAAKTALAIDIFGRSGSQMVQLLNQGKDGIEQMEKAAASMGIVIGQDDADAINNFNDQVDIMNMRLEGLWRMIATTIVPIFNQVYEEFVRITVGIKGLIGEAIAAKNYLANVFSEGTYYAALKYHQEVTALRGEFAKLVEETEKSFNAPPPPKPGEAPATGSGEVPRGNRTAAIKEETEAREKQITVEEAFLQELQKQNEARDYDASIMEAEAAQYAALNEERYLTVQQFAQLNQLYAEGAIKLQEYQDAFIGVTSTMDSQIERTAANITSNLRRIQAFFANVSNANASQWLAMGDTMVDTLSSVFGASKEFAVAAALINTAQAVMKTLAEYGGTPWGWAAAAAVAAMGAAQIAKILSTNEKSGASGGAAVASSTGAAAGAAVGGSQGSSQTLYVQGIDPSHMYSGEAVRNLAEQLLQYQRDGGRVVLAGAA